MIVLRAAEHELETLVLQRSLSGRCPGAWETLHGRIEAGERPEQAAVRELREETGLAAARLYNVRTHAFYLHAHGTLQIAVVFAAIVARSSQPELAEEHSAAEWLPLRDAIARLAWPSERESLAQVAQLLAGGNAGPLEDVLRVF